MASLNGFKLSNKEVEFSYRPYNRHLVICRSRNQCVLMDMKPNIQTPQAFCCGKESTARISNLQLSMSGRQRSLGASRLRIVPPLTGTYRLTVHWPQKWLAVFERSRIEQFVVFQGIDYKYLHASFYPKPSLCSSPTRLTRTRGDLFTKIIEHLGLKSVMIEENKPQTERTFIKSHLLAPTILCSLC